MSASVRWCLLVLILAVAVSGQQQSKKTLPKSPSTISLAEDVIHKDRSTRTVKKIQQKLGFFGTIKNLLFEQINDTRSAYNQVSELVGANFVSEAEAKQPKTTTEEPSEEEDDVEGKTTTQPPPAKLSRDELLNILRRNLIGLRRLFNEEWKQAMKDSSKNIQEYKDQFKNEMFKY